MAIAVGDPVLIVGGKYGASDSPCLATCLGSRGFLSLRVKIVDTGLETTVRKRNVMADLRERAVPDPAPTTPPRRRSAVPPPEVSPQAEGPSSHVVAIQHRIASLRLVSRNLQAQIAQLEELVADMQI